MSKYLLFTEAAFSDRGLLLAALADLGYDRYEVGQGLLLFGFQGDRREETAEVVVRRQHLGRLSNDLGFARTAAGLVPVISEFDQRTLLGGQFLARLRAAYSERVVEAVRRSVRGTAHRTVEGGLVKIRIRW
jgi:hypothetical protein